MGGAGTEGNSPVARDLASERRKPHRDFQAERMAGFKEGTTELYPRPSSLSFSRWRIMVRPSQMSRPCAGGSPTGERQVSNNRERGEAARSRARAPTAGRP